MSAYDSSTPIRLTFRLSSRPRGRIGHPVRGLRADEAFQETGQLLPG